MDITDTLAPKSDQLDAVELLGGPQVFTVKSVSRGSAEQPVEVHLVEFPRCWRPSKGMRRVLAACWGTDASKWVGRRVELYCDPAVRFGNDAVGGTRIRSLSNIDGEQRIPLRESKSKGGSITVKPLASAGAGREPAPAARSTGDTTEVQGRGEHVSAGESPASANRGAAEDDAAASPDAPDELLLDSITRQIAEITEEGGGAHLKTWWASIGIGSSKRALIDRFGDDVRNIRQLMGPVS